MTKTITNNTLGARLAAALDLKVRATEYVPADNPFVNRTVEEVAGDTGHPALNMAAKAPNDPLAYDLEAARIKAISTSKDANVAKRVAQHRARAAKKVEFDRIADLPTPVDPERMELAWQVVFPLVPIVTRIASGKSRWASRFLGSVVDDVAQVVMERMAVILAKQQHYDIHLLIAAAGELGTQAERKGIPGDQMTDDQRKERKQMAKARKWLMGMVNNRVQGTLIDLYTESRNLRWDNLDIITTVMASINGIGDDPMTSNFKANRAPGSVGTKFQRPDGIDSGLVAQAINSAITERGLDGIVEILLNEDNRRSNGSVSWSKIGEAVFLASPGAGEALWGLVCQATEHHAKPKRARADATRTHVRNLFSWLPGFIVQVVESFDLRVVGWSAQPETLVHTPSDEPTRGLATIRLITGTGVLPAPHSAFDGTVDEEGNHWPMTVGQPVGDEVGAEFRDAEEVVVPWRMRGSGVRRTWRAQAIMASDFETLYLGDQPEMRQPLQPALVYASVEDAVEALTRHLDVLTGADLVNGLVHA